MIHHALLRVAALLLLLSACISLAPEPTEQRHAPESKAAGETAVHLVVRSDAEAKQNFTYFPYPVPPVQYRFLNVDLSGVYRLFVDQSGAVTQVQIVKRFGIPAVDAEALKTFVRWRARPGPARIADVSFTLRHGYVPVRRSSGSHIPPH